MTATPLPHERIFVGLDTAEVDKAARLAKLLAGAVGGVKIGKEFFTAQGPDGVRLAVGGAPLDRKSSRLNSSPSSASRMPSSACKKKHTPQIISIITSIT